jgi:hypothetical protein
MLSAYDSDCRITQAGTVINARAVTCDLIVLAPNVRIVNSQTRRIEVGPAPASVDIETSTVDAGNWVGAAVGPRAFAIRRSEVRGGQHGAQCETDCLVEDSWLHGQSLPANEARHLNAFISNGGKGMTIRRNVLSCDPPVNPVDGGCTADLSLFGDFGPISDVTVEENLFRATPGGYCGSFGLNPAKPFGRASQGIRVVQNVFERGPSTKCGVFGAVTSFDESAVGNSWHQNRWSDGGVVGP